jgi:hypothetical protein
MDDLTKPIHNAEETQRPMAVETFEKLAYTVL